MKRFAKLDGTHEHPALIDPSAVVMIAEGRLEDQPGPVCHVVLSHGTTIVVKGTSEEVYAALEQATRLN